MKKFIYILFFMLLGFGAYGQNTNTNIKYIDMGNWYDISYTNILSLHAYYTVEILDVNLVDTTKILYDYKIYFKSNSIFNGKKSKIWIYGLRIFIDDIEVTKKSNPQGLSILIYTYPTKVYEIKYETSNNKPKCRITWDSSAFQSF